MLSFTKGAVVMFLAISLNISGCISLDRSSQTKLKEEPKIAEKVEPIIDPQSLDYLYQADDLSHSTPEPQYEQAIEYYTKAIEADSNNAVAYEGRAYAYKNLEQYDKAIADLTQSIAVDPQNITAYDSRAYIYFAHLKQDERAVADYTKAIALTNKHKPESRQQSQPFVLYKDKIRIESLYKQRANLFLKLEQFDRAIEDANRVVALEPNTPLNYHFRAYAYQKAKQYDNAIADENKAIAMLPEYAHAHPYRGRASIYYELKQYDKAIADYTKAISLYADYTAGNADYAEAYRGRADAYRQSKQYDKAIADYDESLAVYPEYAYTYKSRGELYQEIGEISQAKQDLSQAANLFEERENIEEYQIVQQQLQQL